MPTSSSPTSLSSLASPSSPDSLIDSIDALSLSSASVPLGSVDSHSRRTSLLSDTSLIHAPSARSGRSRQASDASGGSSSTGAGPDISRRARLSGGSNGSEGFEVIDERIIMGSSRVLTDDSPSPRSRASGQSRNQKAAPSVGSHATRSSGDASAGTGISTSARAKGKKTRRSGTRARRRIENGQNREMDAVDDLLGDDRDEGLPAAAHHRPLTPRTPGSSGRDVRAVATPVLPRGGARTPRTARPDAATDPWARGAQTETETEVDEEDEVDGLSDLGLEEGDSDEEVSGRDTPTSSGQVRRRGYAESVLTSDDAESSIDHFLSSTTKRKLTRSEKLVLWQSLCFELGLAYLPTPAALPDLPISGSAASPARGGDTPSSSRSTTPTPRTTPSVLPAGTFGGPSFVPGPMPQTLNTLAVLLKRHGHVNLPDYFAARDAAARARLDSPRSQGQGGTAPGQYAHLLFPSANKMIKYTVENRRFVKLGVAKEEALQPLLRDFKFSHRYRN